jgi:parallel beta-helix repeat protein
MLFIQKRRQAANRQQAVAYTCFSKIVLFFLILLTTPSLRAESRLITATAGAGGKIIPRGGVSVNQGDDITFRMVPDNGYVVANIHTAGVSQGAAESYTFYSVNTNNTLTASFLPAADLIAETIYVDNTLSSDCLDGEYSIENRNNSGNDGNAYTSIIEAANVAGPGDTVLIRAGIYNAQNGHHENDVLWPKHSGSQQSPIVFKPYNQEEVILGDSIVSYPNDNWASIARGVISMRNVKHIEIDGLIIRNVAGWFFARNCSHITVRNCLFENGLYGAKGGARLIESDYCRIINNTFHRSSYDSLVLVESDFNLLQDNTFTVAAHSLLSLRSASFNVIRDNDFSNSYYVNKAAEKLTEVFDQKVDTRDSRNPSYIPVPAYNGTQHNIFEHNRFGYHPDRPYGGSRTSAIQFSGQNTIIRNNIFSNPPLKRADRDYPDGVAGGVAIIMRWGGSWTGWNGNRIVGEGHEAGFVTHNRIYNNVFYGYDNGKVITPQDDIMKRLPNPPPMKNVADYQDYPFGEEYAFADNIFKNNIFAEGRIVPRINWAHLQKNEGMPVQLFLMGRLDTTYFYHNNFFATGQYSDRLIYDHVHYKYQDSKTPAFFNMNLSTFSANVQQDPLFIDANNGDFRLRPDSYMIDSGDFLTFITNPDGSGSQIRVDDVRYFYDGYRIEGETGDLIELESGQTARIARIDYETDKNTITLDRQVSWRQGEGVSIDYFGSAPDIGAYESVPSDPDNSTPVLQKIGNKSINVEGVLTFDINATDPEHEPITYSAQNLPRGATFSDETFSWTPSHVQTGKYQVRFVASDANSKAYETVTITVNAVNRPPVLGKLGR